MKINVNANICLYIICPKCCCWSFADDYCMVYFIQILHSIGFIDIKLKSNFSIPNFPVLFLRKVSFILCWKLRSQGWTLQKERQGWSCWDLLNVQTNVYLCILSVSALHMPMNTNTGPPNFLKVDIYYLHNLQKDSNRLADKIMRGTNIKSNLG